jgi:hypothetical protein
MKKLTLILLSCACFAADERAKTEEPKPITEFPEEATEGEIPGWGFRRNPKRAGKYEAEGDSLKLTVASGADLHPAYNMNGPSVLMEVEGDFIAEVTLDPLPSDHRGWVCGGLIVFAGDMQVARLNHGHLIIGNDTELREVLNWEQNGDDGKLRGINLGSIKIDFTKQRTFRIERRGARLHGAFSNDNGATWTNLYPQNIHRWPAKVKIGPFVANLSSKPKTLRFTAFKVTPKAK